MTTQPVRLFVAEDNPADVWLIEEALNRHSISFAIENYATAAEAINAVSSIKTPRCRFPI